ncbi:MAG: class I SAM-dependent methyltransferase [Chitinispirillaceae bacterium]|nr:class I SAM-dependent methyltransferase [Chitinispirillaceae bacterium]
MHTVLKFRIRVIISILLQRIIAKLDAVFRKKGTNEHWSIPVSWYAPSGFKTYWETLAAIGEYQNEMITGDKKKNYLERTTDYLKKNIGTSGLAGLSIGCGEGARPEMVLFETGYFSSFEVMDIAKGLLDRQEKAARSRGLDRIRYLQQDLNNVVLTPEKYDLIWAVGTIHHIERLEEFFRQVRKALKPGGILVMREYVGPNRIQFTDDQLARANVILATIPVKYRRKWHGLPKKQERRIDREQLISEDPSEAVRSEDILPVLRKELDVVCFANTGGTLLQPILNGIAANFEIVPGGDDVLQELIETEKKLIEEGTIPSDYMFCMAKRKAEPIDT